MGSGVKTVLKKTKTKQQELPFNAREIATLKELANYIDEPILKASRNKISDEMLDNLKKSMPGPVMVSKEQVAVCHNHLTYPFDTPCENCGKANPTPVAPAPKYSFAKERNLKTFNAVKYALRLMKHISYTLGETCFTVSVNRRGYARYFTINSYDGVQFFCELKYSDVNGKERSAGYQTLAMACADVVAVVMYYATR